MTLTDVYSSNHFRLRIGIALIMVGLVGCASTSAPEAPYVPEALTWSEVPPTTPQAIDGTWKKDNGLLIYFEKGKSRHLNSGKLDPFDVTYKNIQRVGPGKYTLEELSWNTKLKETYYSAGDIEIISPTEIVLRIFPNQITGRAGAKVVLTNVNFDNESLFLKEFAGMDQGAGSSNIVTNQAQETNQSGQEAILVQAEELPHRTTSQISPSIYNSVSDKEQTLGFLNIDPGAKVTFDDSPMFESTTHTFVGEIQEFIRGVSRDGLRKVISACHPEYVASSKTNPLLSTAGIVHLNEKGIVEGENAKSGWINMTAYGEYTNSTTGKIERIVFSGIRFWVNKGGKYWWDFGIREAVFKETGEKVKVTPGLESKTDGTNWPYVLVNDKYKFVLTGKNLNSFFFSE